jgi:alpha-D-xyloside xylohydrolase
LCPSGAANEIWSYGEQAYEIFKKYILIREKMKPYITTIMEEAHEKGTPVIRPLFYDFPHDEKCWNISDEYMFGPSLLVAPILYSKERNRKIYLPQGARWKNMETGEFYSGGNSIDCEAPIDIIPVFIRDNANVPIN